MDYNIKLLVLYNYLMEEIKKQNINYIETMKQYIPSKLVDILIPIEDIIISLYQDISNNNFNKIEYLKSYIEAEEEVLNQILEDFDIYKLVELQDKMNIKPSLNHTMTVACELTTTKEDMIYARIMNHLEALLNIKDSQFDIPNIEIIMNSLLEGCYLNNFGFHLYNNGLTDPAYNIGYLDYYVEQNLIRSNYIFNIFDDIENFYDICIDEEYDIDDQGIQEDVYEKFAYGLATLIMKSLETYTQDEYLKKIIEAELQESDRCFICEVEKSICYNEDDNNKELIDSCMKYLKEFDSKKFDL